MTHPIDNWRNWDAQGIIDELTKMRPDHPLWGQSKAVLDFKIAEKHLYHAEQLARLTRWLMLATWVLAFATAGLIIATVLR